MSIRVRFAPSPTGNLHLGTARAALFNWLFARRTGGVMILRIEDTDMKRSETAFEASILQGLEYLGIDYDEGPDKPGKWGPYRQSEKMAEGVYNSVAQSLIASGHAYRCFCTPEDLDAERAAAEANSKPYIYSQKCAKLSEAERNEKLAAGTIHTIRFQIPATAGMIQFDDIIRGHLEFDSQLLGDFVIMKSDGSPSYNFAVVVDDIQMEISHVIRGEDHISNTPRQILVYRAMKKPIPQFAHLPMILGSDRSKLSKRHGATNVIDYKSEGYLGTAMVNYLALLGWSPPDEKEIRSVGEIASIFELERVNKSGAIFDLKKLKWMNGQYIRQIPVEALLNQIIPALSPQISSGFLSLPKETQIEMLKLVHDNFELVNEINVALHVFFLSPAEYSGMVNSFSFSDEERTVAETFLNLVENADRFDDMSVAGYLENVKTQTGLGTGKVFKPLRKICTGYESGPHISTVISLLGKSVIGDRLRRFLGA